MKNFLQKDDFYQQARDKILSAATADSALVSLDFDNFNFINDLFGFQTGDLALKKMSEHFDEVLSEGEFFTRIHADHYYFLVKDQPDILSRFYNATAVGDFLSDILPEHYNFVSSGGVVRIKDSAVSLSTLLDQANYARKKAKGNNVNTVLLYDEKMDQELVWRKIITLNAEDALANHEFEMYLQPKVEMRSQVVIGAEALVRWNSPEYGFILPDRFIPVLEQNGFIRKLDLFMLSEACNYLNVLKKECGFYLPVSVNFSKLHLHSADFIEKVKETVRQYNIPTKYIELELTENIFSDDFSRLIECASALKKEGFKVSLDDFGSAYSSLNYLKELPLDIIKIDKGFLSQSSDSEKGRVIIAKMVELIKSLRMVSVMEGVETAEQVEFLEKLGCDIAQGYFYARPMTADKFTEYVRENADVKEIGALLADSSSDGAGYQLPAEFGLDHWELYSITNNIDVGLMKGYLDDSSIHYVNEVALGYLGYTREELKEQFGNSILPLIYPEDLALIENSKTALQKLKTPVKFIIRAVHKNRKTVFLQGQASCVTDPKGRQICIYAFQDVTAEMERIEGLKTVLEQKVEELERAVRREHEIQESLRLSEERYRLIIEQTDDIMFDWNFADDTILFSDKYEKVFGEAAVHDRVRAGAKVRVRIHPDDLPSFERWVESTYRKCNFSEAEFRVRAIDGNYLWMRVRSTAILDSNGAPIRAVGLFANINKQKMELDNLTLKSQLDPLTHLYNKEETRRRIEFEMINNEKRSAAFIIIDIDNFKGVNDNLGHQFGDSVLKEVSDKLRKFFRGNEVVGRLGGDEIIVYMNSIADAQEAYDRTEQLIRYLRGTYFGLQTKYDVSVSAGIALFPAQTSDYEELYRMADVALYESKRKGKDCCTLYHSEISEPIVRERTPMEWADRFLSNYFDGDLIYSVFEMLYETHDMDITIQKVLELVGKKFNVDRVYIFENSTDGRYTSNTYEWCADGITAEKENLQNLDNTDLKNFLATFNSEGIMYCDDIQKMDDYSFQVLNAQGIKSMLHCAVIDEGVKAGFIGFDMCRGYREWKGDEIATLAYLSRILSVFLLKKQKMNEMLDGQKNYSEMLNNLGGFVYVIDNNTYEILYVNQKTADAGLTVGSTCYRQTYGADHPCDNCPVKQLTKDKHQADVNMYSEVIGKWVNSSASSLHWQGRADVALVYCSDISHYVTDCQKK